MNLFKKSLIALACSIVSAVCARGGEGDFVLVSDVVPDAVLEIRYFSTYNFIGERIPGYEEPVAMMTRRAADSLKRVSDDLRAKGYRIKIFDAYRPQRAVDKFVKWAGDASDTAMKACFYPELDKTALIPRNYIAARSSHSRGSTVDLTLFDISTGKEVDMGCPFDYFGEVSHPDVLPGQECGGCSPINESQYANRMILRDAMMSHGFKPFDSEWWHFTLDDEPYPDTYFDIPVNSDIKNIMKTITILVAEEAEEKMVRRFIPEAECIRTGVGASNVIKTCCGIPPGTRVFNIGYAGSNHIAVGTICRVSTSHRLMSDAYKFEDYNNPAVFSDDGLPCYTGNSFVTETDIEIPALFDMELNYIAAFPFEFVGAIKIVSDNLSVDNFQNNAIRESGILTSEDVWKNVRELYFKIIENEN